MKAGTGIFFDGLTSARREVSVELKSDGVVIRDPVERDQLARWPYDELDQIAAPEGVFRVARAGSKQLARLEVRDPELAAAIDEASVPVDRSGAGERRSRRKIIAWSFAAVVSLVLGAVFGVPALATHIAPFIPWRVERILGEAVDVQIRAMLDTKKAGSAFECGAGEGEAQGRAALERLVRKLEAVAALPVPLTPIAVRREDTNAITLPGGRIYVYQGIIEKLETVDELAGVIAHEIGHVAHRDGTRSVLQAAGLSFMFGMLLGDFVGGGAVVLGAKTLLQLSYSRDVEAAADRYGVELMGKAGGDPRALGTALTRIAGANHPGMRILLDHPDTESRVAAINALAPPRSTSSDPLLEPPEWAALKRICAGP
jgi:Zn-dependent protease with chaperone function